MNINMKSSASVSINGKTFSGRNISIVNNQVVVDGKTQEGELTGSVSVVVNGDIETLDTQMGDVTANNVGEVNTGSGDVSCGAVSGSVRTGSGDVSCGIVGGNVRTGSGDVSHR